jgi:hypothetical protein
MSDNLSYTSMDPLIVLRTRYSEVGRVGRVGTSTLPYY